MKKEKIIGIYADTYNGKIGQTLPYMQFFSQFGYVRMISTLDKLEGIENEIDALVIPGGSDVDPLLYNNVPGAMDSRTNMHYEYLDKILIQKFINVKKPLIGICRGMQRLNVFFGGTLEQHIIGHHQGDNRIKTEQVAYFINENTGKYDQLFNINTMHHQCVGILGDNLSVLAYSDLYKGSYLNYKPNIFEKNTKIKDKIKLTNVYGVPEIITHDFLPIIGFQYHPEEFNCNIAVDLINNIL